MYALQFDETKCLHCEGQDCLAKCQHIHIERNGTEREMVRIARGEDSFALTSA